MILVGIKMNDEDFGPWIAHNGNEMPKDLKYDDVIQIVSKEKGEHNFVQKAIYTTWHKDSTFAVRAYRVKKKPTLTGVIIKWCKNSKIESDDIYVPLLPNGKPDLYDWLGS